MENIKRGILRDAVVGGIGGVLGTYVMGHITTILYRFEREDRKRREEALRSEPPYQVMAEWMAKGVFRRELDPQTRKRAGMALHWGYGIAWGAAYGVLRKRVPVLSRAGGLPFALTFALIGDEGLNTVFGLTPPPQRFPWEAHARGLAGHVAFTATAEGLARLSEKAAA